MHKMLEEIIEKTKIDLKLRKVKTPVEKLYPQILKLQGTLAHAFLAKMYAVSLVNLGVIAEIKLASPSAGEISTNTDIEAQALEYQKAGADAISVVTEKSFFKGDLQFIPQVIKSAPGTPVLHKDFVIDPYQIYESKTLGSNALLLIARILPDDHLKAFVDICLETGLDPVVEVNSLEDLERAVKTNTQIIAVNARDLDTFEVNVEQAAKLLKKIPHEYLKLGFSGVNSDKEAELYHLCGANAVLVGTKLMQVKDKKRFIKEIKNVS